MYELQPCGWKASERMLKVVNAHHRNNHTFQTPASATAATNAILVELFLQFAQTHVKACASWCVARFVMV